MSRRLNELALFAGAGGGLLGSKLLGWRTLCAVELNEYRRSILIQRQEDGIFDFFPIWDDARTFNGRPFCGHVDIITGGFPCQPYSRAGTKLGENDSRNLWPDTIRIIREVRPSYCLLENVDNLLSYDYFGTILSDLATSGFDVKYDVISAATVGANHLRKRLWIMCYANNKRKSTIPIHDEAQKLSSISNCNSKGLEGLLRHSTASRWERAAGPIAETNWWAIEPGICRVDDGMANRMDRIEAIGLGQVPAVVRAAWHLLGECNE